MIFFVPRGWVIFFCPERLGDFFFKATFNLVCIEHEKISLVFTSFVLICLPQKQKTPSDTGIQGFNNFKKPNFGLRLCMCFALSISVNIEILALGPENLCIFGSNIGLTKFPFEINIFKSYFM